MKELFWKIWCSRTLWVACGVANLFGLTSAHSTSSVVMHVAALACCIWLSISPIARPEDRE